MLFVLNKNKIISYAVAASVVAVLFLFSTFLLPKDNVQLVPASSSNVVNQVDNEIKQNNL